MKKLIGDARRKTGEGGNRDSYPVIERIEPPRTDNIDHWKNLYSPHIPPPAPISDYKIPESSGSNYSSWQTKNSYSAYSQPMQKPRTEAASSQPSYKPQTSPRPVQQEKKPEPELSADHYHPYGNNANCPACHKDKAPKQALDLEAFLNDDDGVSVGLTELMEEISKYEKTETGNIKVNKSSPSNQQKSERGNFGENPSKEVPPPSQN